MPQQIVNGVLVTTTEQDLSEFIARKQQEFNMFGQEITKLQQLQRAILAELSSLVNQQEAQ